MKGFKFPAGMIVCTIWMLWFGVVLVPLLWSVLGAFEYWKIGQAEAASWIQAVGSIAAIASGVGVLIYQQNEKDRDAEIAHQRMIEKIVTVAVHISAIFDSTDPLNSYYDLEVGIANRLKSRLEESRNLLREISLQELPTHELCILWLEWRQGIDDLLTYYSSYVTRPDDAQREQHAVNFQKAWLAAKTSCAMIIDHFRIK